MDGSPIPVVSTGSDFFSPQFSRRKIVLVAGGAGFLGSHLCDNLIADGHSVVCLDNLQTGRMENIAGLLKNDRFHFVRHDITNALPWDGPLDEIYNLACAASPPLYQKDPIHTFRTCTEGVLNLLGLARRTGARILQSSTSEVYGDPEVTPQREGYRGAVNTIGPRACYDEGKRAAETLFWEFGAHQGVEVRIARIFNTYGPRMSPDDGRVVSNFVVQALTGADLTLYGDGMQTRSFCYVDDMVAGLRRLMASECSLPVNLGNPGEFTMRELADRVLRLTGSRSRIVHHPLPVDDPRQRRPDIGFAKSVLGWAPTVPLEQGLALTIRHFADELKTLPLREAELHHV
ncbi:SDR family oxidoreductase [Cereibacter sphaeroides]|uniref:UDP-glucuronic acid decarboxylase family protein n=1 Tax=Cereibacter sphaeroides TaxID=1063 RepID=UPI001F286B97|nr:UDP-glucuronic acid decarboxylase family protein [Cereibacter sphaeroides]MCE6953072.1 SDR family oxidoreductase [Cereibacter sphaeroides]MCE6961829.1 SDR family oxidoreductase [Cereibacter sphaeroides]MCE6970604.1 SDR family oxidoreductase [Cereibacter sphaeroides]MCE6975800.1 SDR family oxidoreductase [Cereibacter sphaeroides]